MNNINNKKYGINYFRKHVLLVCDRIVKNKESDIKLARTVESDRYYNLDYEEKVD